MTARHDSILITGTMRVHGHSFPYRIEPHPDGGYRAEIPGGEVVHGTTRRETLAAIRKTMSQPAGEEGDLS